MKAHHLNRLAAAAALALLVPGVCMAQAASTDMRAQGRAAAMACRGDYQKLCADVQPGGGRILACLKAHQPALSAPCAAAMSKAEALRSRAAEAGALPK